MMLLRIYRHNTHLVLTLIYELLTGSMLIQVNTENIYITITWIEAEVMFRCIICLGVR